MSGNRSSRRSRLIRWIIFLVILFPASGGIVYLFWYSPVFIIKGVEFSGATLSQEEANDLLGGSPVGYNILFWQPSEAHVLGPRFASLEINRNYFSRTIEVSITERDKDMVWCFETNSVCYWVYGSGFIFSQAPLFSGSLVIVITDSRETPLEIGSYVLSSSMNSILNKILAILAKLNVRIDDIRLENIKLRELITRVHSGPRIIFSLDIDPAFTETAISSLIKAGSWSKIKSLNLTVPDRAYPSF